MWKGIKIIFKVSTLKCGRSGEMWTREMTTSLMVIMRAMRTLNPGPHQNHGHRSPAPTESHAFPESPVQDWQVGFWLLTHRGNHPCLSTPVNMSKEIPVCQSMGDLPDPYEHFNCVVLLLWAPEASLGGRLEAWIWTNTKTDEKFLEPAASVPLLPVAAWRVLWLTQGGLGMQGQRIQQQPTEQMKCLTFIDFRGEEGLILEKTSLSTADEPRYWIE